MSHDERSERWVPHTDGRRVWAVNAATGVAQHYMHCDQSRITGVHAVGDSVGISLSNGRTVVWNPATGSSRSFL